MNLIAVLKESLTDSVVSRAAYYVDEKPEKTKVALEGLVYTVVAGLMKRTTTEIGVGQLFNAIQKGKADASLVSSFSAILNDPEQTRRLADEGNYSISHLLPAMKSSIGTMISSYANIRNSAAITLLGLVTPLALGILHQTVQEKKLDADSLALLLADQRDHLIENTPERLLEKMAEGLGINQLLAVGVVPAKRNAALERPQRVGQERPRFVPEPEEDNNGSLAKWGVGALVLAALVGGGYYIWNNTQSYSDANQEETAISTEFTDTTSGVAPTNLRDSLAGVRPNSSSLATPTTTTVTNGTATAELAAYLANPQAPAGRTFKQPALLFEPGTSIPSAELQPTVNELVNLMKANPTMQIQLIGYANDARLPTTNKFLSGKRANIVKQQMVQAGINFVRIDAVGYGTGVRIKPGDSLAAKKPTRREIMVKIVSK
ncbi:OmpA family protein [Tellurirhabdus bombi]|uniref:OmpA family protein n=1 Tax=Tellurirhabdus bombi TaxID=2907205 RepID=UPI001F2923BC|nr:OmpA family protein [Tellurirhabdus bombi]